MWTSHCDKMTSQLWKIVNVRLGQNDSYEKLNIRLWQNDTTVMKYCEHHITNQPKKTSSFRYYASRGTGSNQVSGGSWKETLNVCPWLCLAQQMTDAVGQAAASALHGPMQSLLRDVVQNRVIPAFEHSTQTMANQVNSAFQDGTKECQSPTTFFFFLLSSHTLWKLSLIHIWRCRRRR